MSDSEKSEISFNEDFTLFEDEEEFSSSKSESDISFDKEFSLFEDASKLTPFNFEPLLSSSDEDEYHTAEEGELRNEKRISRLDNLNWCKCRKCVVMETNLECICCQELNEVSDEKLEGSECISQTETFQTLCLHTEVLTNVISSLNELGGESLDIKNKNYRYAAYRQYVWWIYTKLGKGVRRVLPSCVVKAIREKFPEDDNIYVPFRYTQKL